MLCVEEIGTEVCVKSHFSVSDILPLFVDSPFLEKNAFLLGQKFLLGDARTAVLPSYR